MTWRQETVTYTVGTCSFKFNILGPDFDECDTEDEVIERLEEIAMEHVVGHLSLPGASRVKAICLWSERKSEGDPA